MTKSKEKYMALLDVKSKILMAIMGVTFMAFILTAIINILNHRPILNVIYPFVGSLVMVFMYKRYHNKKNQKLIKNLFLIFLCFLYLPLSWITSPGSYSAMAFYGIVILFVAIILVNEPLEYIYPVVTVIINILLYHYEVIHPEQYHLYTTPSLRALDLSINYLIASGVLFTIAYIINHYFGDEHKRIFNTSVTDPLTGLFNRRYLYHYLENLFSSKGMPLSQNAQFTLMLIDLNHFKKINDTYGHLEGDEVLCRFAEILKVASRKSDIPIRFGGDEFILILQASTEADAHQVEVRINELFAASMKKYNDLDFSVGFGYANSNTGTIDDIIRKADDLLYKNKEMTKQKL